MKVSVLQYIDERLYHMKRDDVQGGKCWNTMQRELGTIRSKLQQAITEIEAMKVGSSCSEGDMVLDEVLDVLRGRQNP